MAASIPSVAHGSPKAFPGAEGFGASTPGGRGGRVLFVTNLNDDGPGSLRAAVKTKGPRIILFRVGGLIDLKSTLKITEPYVTIAGQTATGDGVCLRNYGLVIEDCHDVIIRHLRVRPGDTQKEQNDGIIVYRSRDVIIDHCSASWSVDETLDVSDEWKQVAGAPKTRNVTIQWCIFSEALNRSVHDKGRHGYAALISAIRDGGVSVHHTLFAHHYTRIPRPGGRENEPGLLLDFRNNVIYDWGKYAGYSAESPTASSVRMNYIGNYLKPGPSNEEKGRNIAFQAVPSTRIFAEGNLHLGDPGAAGDNWRLFQPEGKFGREAAPFPVPTVRTDAAAEVYERVLQDAGAALPSRDAVDARVIEQVRRGGGRIIDSQQDVGGWPAYRGAAAPRDSDDDGMADNWETRHRLDPCRTADHAEDADSDGYTNLEEYLNRTDPHRPA